MARRFYTNVSTEGTLDSAVGASDTTFSVVDFNSLPAVPFTAVVAKDTASEEVVLVTQVSGGTLTVTRGYDSTSGSSHGGGTTIEHAIVAEGPNKWDAHVEASSNVHGVTGDFVDTDSAQTIENKTFSDNVYTGTNSSSPAGGSALFEAVADDASRPAFLANTTGQSSAKGFTVQQSGVDRFLVNGDGTVEIAPSGSPTVALDVLGRLDVDNNLNVGGDAGVTGTLVAGEVDSGGPVSGTTATFTGAASVDSLDSNGAVTGTDLTALNNLTVSGDTVVDGLNAGATEVDSLDVNGAVDATGAVTSDINATNRSVRQPVVHRERNTFDVSITPSLTVIDSFTWTQTETGNVSFAVEFATERAAGPASTWASADVSWRLRVDSTSTLLAEEGPWYISTSVDEAGLPLRQTITVSGCPSDVLSAGTDYRLEILAVENSLQGRNQAGVLAAYTVTESVLV